MLHKLARVSLYVSCDLTIIWVLVCFVFSRHFSVFVYVGKRFVHFLTKTHTLVVKEDVKWVEYKMYLSIIGANPLGTNFVPVTVVYFIVLYFPESIICIMKEQVVIAINCHYCYLHVRN
eukprot:GHVL01033289.1.p1 GENE.GHVL01033289.1~~GHVL01033289.1.p1  ORF type:complete len:119 (+),score=0.67 GHVL01033289.1:385-741(+)